MIARKDYYSERTVRGRADYQCGLCRAPIAKGQEHITLSCGSGGSHWTQRVCLPCHRHAVAGVEHSEFPGEKGGAS